MQVHSSPNIGADGLDGLRLERRFPIYYGIALSLFNEKVSVCSLICGRDGTSTIDPHGTWKRPLEEQHALRDAITAVTQVFDLQQKAFRNLPCPGFQMPVLLAVPDSSPTLIEQLKSFDQHDFAISEVPLKDALVHLISVAADTAEYPLEGIHLYDGAYGGSPSCTFGEQLFATPSKRELRGKIDWHGRRFEAAGRTGDRAAGDRALQQLQRLAVRETRMSIRDDQNLPDPIYKKDSPVCFVKYIAPECRYFDHPLIQAAVEKEFNRKGYRGRVVFSYPDTPPAPYFSSLLSVILESHRDKGEASLLQQADSIRS